MGLKFRRGTNAQKSGSLAFGEPYVNTDLGTLQIGGLAGDITLGASGTGSAGSFSDISGSGLDITGNANIAGNVTVGGQLTIGDQTSDTVNVVASLSSSLIPQTTNAFDLGSATKIWRDLYISTGSIKFIDGSGAVASTLTANSLNSISSNTASVNTFTASVNGHIVDINTKTGSFEAKFTTLQTLTASMAAQVTRLQESTASLNLYTSSQDTKNTTLATYTASVSGHITDINTKTGSFEAKNTTLGVYTASIDTKFTTLQTLTASMAAQVSRLQESTASLNLYTSSQDTKNTTLATYTASIDTKFSTLQTLTASMAAQVSRLQESTASLNAFTNSFNSAIQLTGSNVNIGGNLIVAGTTTTINSTAVAIADSVIELNYGGSVVKGGILIKDGTGGSTISGSLLWDGTNDYWIAGISGSELPLATTTGTQTLTNKTIDGSQLVALSVANGKLANSSITIAGTSTTLGGAITAEQIRTAIGMVVTGSAQIDGSQLGSNKTITVGSTAITLGGTATTIAGLTSVTSTGFTGALTGNATTVTNGVYTTDTGTVTSTMILDGTIVNGDINASAAIVDTKLATIATAGKVSNSATTATSANTNSAIVARDASGNFTATTITAALSGNATTATTLQTTRAINGVNFDGSAAITVTAAAGTLSGATLASGVTASSLTSVGTLTSLTVTGAITANGGVTVTGAITATGDITAYYTSDKRHKNNIQTIPNALEKVTKLNGVTWEWNDDVNEVTKSTPKTGLIAQEVQEVLPEVVKTRDDGFLALDYSKMMGLMVEAIKEQQTQIHSLTLEIKKLKESKGL